MTPEVKLFLEQWYYELNFVRTLNLDQYNDNTLENAVQDHVNIKYGIKRRWFTKYTSPCVYCRINTIQKAKSAIAHDDAKKLFWNKSLGNTDIEKQWELDLKYYKKI